MNAFLFLDLLNEDEGMFKLNFGNYGLFFLLFISNYGCSNQNFVDVTCRTKSNQFDFVRHVAATTFCRGNKIFDKIFLFTRRNLLLLRVAVICRPVCSGLKEINMILSLINSFYVNHCTYKQFSEESLY